MTTKAKTFYLIALLFVLIIISITVFVASNLKSRQQVAEESVEERLRRELAPGTPVVLSAEDQKRLEAESQPKKTGAVTLDAETKARLEAESQPRGSQ